MKPVFVESSYAEAKKRAIAYERVKKSFQNYLARNNWGEWVRKPKDRIEAFYK